MRGNSSAQFAMEDYHNNPNHRLPELIRHVNTPEGTKSCPGQGQEYTKTGSIYNYVQLNTSKTSHAQTLQSQMEITKSDNPITTSQLRLPHSPLPMANAMQITSKRGC